MCCIDGVEMNAGIYNHSGEMASKVELAIIWAAGSIQKCVAPCELPSFDQSPYNMLTMCPSSQATLQKTRSKAKANQFKVAPAPPTSRPLSTPYIIDRWKIAIETASTDIPAANKQTQMFPLLSLHLILNSSTNKRLLLVT